MAGKYELWDLPGKSIFGVYDSEDAALAGVRRAMEAYGREFIEDLALGYESRGSSRRIAAGAELAERALRAVRG